MLKRPGVPEMCEQWREHQLEDDIIADFMMAVFGNTS